MSRVIVSGREMRGSPEMEGGEATWGSDRSSHRHRWRTQMNPTNSPFMARSSASRSLVLALVLFAAGTSVVAGQAPVLQFSFPPSVTTQVDADLGDLDNDGRSDVVYSDGTDTFCYSGTGALLYTFPGRSLPFVPGDVNGDGHDDVVVRRGAPVAGAEIYSGFDGSLIHQVLGVGIAYGARTGDVNGDGFDDFMLSPTANPLRVDVHSGSTAAVLWSAVADPSLSIFFGTEMSAVGDVNNDGFDDVAISGATHTDAPNEVRLLSGVDGSLLHRYSVSQPMGQPQNPQQFGTSHDGLGDIDGDGYDDFMISSPGFVAGVSRVAVYSGQTWAEIQVFSMPSSEGHFGNRLAAVPDVDGDGKRDIMASLWDTVGETVRYIVMSSVTGSVLRELPAVTHATGFFFPQSMEPVAGGDVHGDGVPDFLHGTRESGRVSVYSSVMLQQGLYPGTGEGLELNSGLHGGIVDGFSTKLLSAGETVSLGFEVPSAYANSELIVFVQLFDTANGMPSLAGFPVHLDWTLPSVPVIGFRSIDPVFGSLLTLPSSFSIPLTTIPAGLGGKSLSVQAFSVAGAASSNGLFTASEAHELRILY